MRTIITMEEPKSNLKINEPPIVQSLWVGDALSTMERLSIASFLYHSHPFHLYVYNEVKDVPDGVILKDAHDIIPADKIFTYKHHHYEHVQTYAGFSDLFRYKLLLDKGGIWSDIDMVCLRPFRFDLPYVFSSEAPPNKRFIRRLIGQPNLTNIGVIKVPASSELMAFCYEQANRRDPRSLAFGETGPQLFDHAVRQFGLEPYVLPPAAFCPIHWPQWQQLISSGRLINWWTKRKIRLVGSYAVHLWRVMWQINRISSDLKFNPNCLYEEFKRRFLTM